MRSLCESMSSDDLHRILSQHPDTAKIFEGVYPANYLPYVPCQNEKNTNCLIVVHTEPAHIPYGHWQCMYIVPNERKIFFFDTFGRAPHVKFHQTFIERTGFTCFFNTMRIQDTFSESCGQFVCIFALCCSRLHGVHQFHRYFNNDVRLNEMRVHCYFTRSFHWLTGMTHRVTSRILGRCDSAPWSSALRVPQSRTRRQAWQKLAIVQ